MKVQKLNKTSLIMGGVILFIVAMLTIAVSSMVMSNANAEEETAADSNISVHLVLKAQDNNDQPIQGVKVVTYKSLHSETKRDVGETDQNGKIDTNMDFDEGVSYEFIATYGTQKLTTMEDFSPIKTQFNYTFKFTAPEPVKQTVTVTANGDKSAEFRYLSKGGVYDEAHEIQFDCTKLDDLKIEPDDIEGSIYIKEGSDIKCILKDNIDFKLTKDKVTQSADKKIFTVNVNTEPILDANFKVAEGQEDRGFLSQESLKIPKNCKYTTKWGEIDISNTVSNGETIYVNTSAKGDYLFDFWSNASGDETYVSEGTVENDLNLTANFKTKSSNDVTIISDKPVYLGNIQIGDRQINWEDNPETKHVIKVSDIERDIYGIFVGPSFFFRFFGDSRIGDENSARLISYGPSDFQPAPYNYVFSYDKDVNNLIPYDQIKVIEWTGPDNRSPKTISIGGATTAQETAEGSAQTGDITYIAIALLVCVGITSAVVAVRVKARRK